MRLYILVILFIKLILVVKKELVVYLIIFVEFKFVIIIGIGGKDLLLLYLCFINGV